MAGAVRDAAELVASVDKARYPMAESLAAEVLWQAGKLEDARRLIRSSSVLVEYDNGGGQRGVRKNPAYEAYNQLFASFAKGVALLGEMLEASGAPPEEAGRLAALRGGLRAIRGGKAIGE